MTKLLVKALRNVQLDLTFRSDLKDPTHPATLELYVIQKKKIVVLNCVN